MYIAIGTPWLVKTVCYVLFVHVNKSFNFNEHCENILTKANQKFGVLAILLLILIGDEFFILPWSEAGSSIARQYGGHVVTP